MTEFQGPIRESFSSQPVSESILRRFDHLWHAGHPPEITDFLNQHPESRGKLLVELVHADLEYRLAHDRSTRVESYFDRFPNLLQDRGTAVKLIQHEFRLRSQLEELEPDEYAHRFPQFESELEASLSRDDLLNSSFAEVTSQIQRLLGHAQDNRPVGNVQPGDSLGRYQIVNQIGKGAFGTVYGARDSQLNRTVAIKVPHPAVSSSPRAMDRLLREARHAARLKHPSIVPILDVGFHAGAIYLVSAYIAGRTLAERIECEGLTQTTAVRMLADVAHALHFAHQHGVIHRDVKPSNLIVDDQGKLHLTDFGLSRADDDQSELTLEGELLGTPAYLSPEQARGEASRVDARTDIYSLGVVMYQLLTNQLPFEGDSRTIVHQVIYDEPARLRRVNSSIPRDLETICMKSLAKERHERFGSAEEMAVELERYLRNEPICSRPIGRTARLVRWCRRKPVLSGALAFSVVTIFLATVSVLWHTHRVRMYRQSSVEAGIIARQMVDRMLRRVELEMGDSADAELTHRQLALEADKYFLQVAELGPDEPGTRAMLAAALYRVGNMNVRIGEDGDAARRFAEAKEHWQKLFEQNPSQSEFQYRLVKACQRLAVSQIRIGEYEEAAKSMELAVQLAEDLVERFPKRAKLRSKLAEIYGGLSSVRDITGPFEAKRDALIKAKVQREQLVRIDPSHNGYRRVLAETYRSVGSLDPMTGTGSRLTIDEKDVSFWDAQLLERARVIQQQLVDKGRELPWVAIDLSDTLATMGMLKFRSDYDGFRRCLERAGDVLRETLAKYPNVEKIHLSLAAGLLNFAKYELLRENDVDALALLHQSAKHYRSFLTARPLTTSANADLAAVLILAGQCSSRLDDAAAANTYFNEANVTLASVEKHAETNARLESAVAELRAAIDARDVHSE